MKPLNYTVSLYGLGIVVGISGDKEQAEQDAVLAQNLYGSYFSDDLFDYSVHLRSFKQFRKFLILKEYFRIWDEYWTRNKVSGFRPKMNWRVRNKLVGQFTRRAIKRAKLILESNVTFENFMQGMSARNNEYSMASA